MLLYIAWCDYIALPALQYIKLNKKGHFRLKNGQQAINDPEIQIKYLSNPDINICVHSVDFCSMYPRESSSGVTKLGIVYRMRTFRDLYEINPLEFHLGRKYMVLVGEDFRLQVRR